MPDPETQAFDAWAPACLEYFRAYSGGRFDEDGQFWFILVRSEIRADPDRGALVVGHAGVDGIEFCFRQGYEGVWAYYPIEQKWTLKAGTLEQLERNWLNGSLRV